MVRRRRAWFSPWRMTLVASSIIAVSFILLIVSFATARQNRTIFGSNLGGDWLAFQNAATILNHDGPQRLYDARLQQDLFHRALPDEPLNVSLPYANAPLLAKLIQPLGRLSYRMVLRDLDDLFNGDVYRVHRDRLACREPATRIVLVDSVALPVVRTAIPGMHSRRTDLGDWNAGALRCRLSAHRSPAPGGGVVLSICTYKPTLLPIVLLLLLATRQRRVIGGFACGGLFIATVSLIFMGTDCCRAYARICWPMPATRPPP